MNPTAANAAWILADIAFFADPSGILTTAAHAVKAVRTTVKTVHAAEEIAHKANVVKDVAKAVPKYVPLDASGKYLLLPSTDGKMVNGTTHIPESMAPHSQIGWANGRNGDYIQTLEWGNNGVPVKRIDWTDHGRPDNHTNPHEHLAKFVSGSWSFK